MCDPVNAKDCAAQLSYFFSPSPCAVTLDPDELDHAFPNIEAHKHIHHLCPFQDILSLILFLNLWFLCARVN